MHEAEKSLKTDRMTGKSGPETEVLDILMHEAEKSLKTDRMTGKSGPETEVLESGTGAQRVP